MIDKPNAPEDRDKSVNEENQESRLTGATRYSPKTASKAQARQPDKDRNYSEYIMRPFKAFGRGLKKSFLFFDGNAGGVQAIATVAIVVLTLFYVRYARKQWGEMKTSGEHYDQLTKQLITAAGQQATAANQIASAANNFSASAASINTQIKNSEADFKRMALDAERSLKAAGEFFKTDQRSWLKIEYSWPRPISTAPAIVKLTFQNTGKSVITSIYAESSFDVVESDKPPSFNLEKRHNTTSQAALFPTDTNPTRAVLWGQKTKTPRGFTDEEIQSLLAGKSYVTVYGMVLYADQFGVHWYRFCGWSTYAIVDGTANAEDCVAWNRVGDGRPNIRYEKQADTKNKSKDAQSQ